MERPAPIAACLTDGHAGNRRQAEALARALGLEPALHVPLQPSPMAKALSPRTFPGARRALGPAFAEALAAPPEIAIGCGRQGALATRLLRDAGSRTVQILDPRIDPAHWDWVIAPAHDGLSGPNVIGLEGSLNEVDDAWLERSRADFPQLGSFNTPRVALLVGGPGRHWNPGEGGFAAALESVRRAVFAAGGSLMATASRRTPDSWRHRLAEAGAVLAWTGEQDGANPYRGLLGWANVIICTADSVNMLSEACATRVPVGVLGMDHLHGRPRAFAEACVRHGRAHPFDGVLPEAGEVTPLRETARVAAILRPRLLP